jgi:hypothetical protein
VGRLFLCRATSQAFTVTLNLGVRFTTSPIYGGAEQELTQRGDEALGLLDVRQVTAVGNAGRPAVAQMGECVLPLIEWNDAVLDAPPGEGGG